MNTEPNTAAPGMGDALGARLTEYLGSIYVDGRLALDPFDARDIDALIEEIQAALAAQPAPVYGCDFCGSDYTDAKYCCQRRREYLNAYGNHEAAQPAPVVGEPVYDRELIADMLTSDCATWTGTSVKEQADLLRAAANRDAAGVHTATRPAESVAQGGEVPDGWTLVPVNATDAMRNVGVTRYQEFADDHSPYTAEGERQQFQAVWSAMIAAKPATPTPATGSGGEAACWVKPGLIDACKIIGGAVPHHRVLIAMTEREPFTVPLYTHPAPLLAARPGGEEITSGDFRWHVLFCPAYPGGIDFDNKEQAIDLIRRCSDEKTYLSAWWHQANRKDYTPEETRAMVAAHPAQAGGESS